MNIFFLDRDPAKAARYHCNKHVVKMILESAQLLCTAHRVLDGVDNDTLYRATHHNHPCAIWVRSSVMHYRWLYELMRELNEEFKRRYKGVDHLSWTKLKDLLRVAPLNIPMTPWTDPPQCMPEHYHRPDVVEAYMAYYIQEKAAIAAWPEGETPEWFQKG